MSCQHTDRQRNDALFDLSNCPICQRETIRRLETENSELRQTIIKLRAGRDDSRPPMTVRAWRDYLARAEVVSRDDLVTVYAISGRTLTVTDDGGNDVMSVFVVSDESGKAIFTR